MLSAGMFTAFASSMALRSRGLDSGAPPPRRAAMVISLMSFVKSRPRFASAAPFLCLIVLHLLWPDMVAPQIFLLQAPDYIDRFGARGGESPPDGARVF